ncbi:MAG: TrmB family transcriptional regulator [Candidatus Aenigmarchaeota archaeon]|nr:TrmB family transcriptional regulator [Candidatus Aenigmarchaeota archaeon]
MVVSNEVLDGLKGIGLNLYERKIFVALLAKGIATAGEVSNIAKVPRSRSYDILESLSEKGFVVLQPSKPIRYVALEPKDALERVKQNLERKHEELQERVDKFSRSNHVVELENLFKQGFSLIQPFEMTGTIKGRHAINQQMRSLFKKAKDKITVITTQSGLEDLHKAHFNTLKKASKKGIKVRIFAPIEGNKERHVSELKQVAELKHLESPLGRVATVDNDNVMLSLTDDSKIHETQDVAFWANSQHLVKDVMAPLFGQIGKK